MSETLVGIVLVLAGTWLLRLAVTMLAAWIGNPHIATAIRNGSEKDD